MELSTDGPPGWASVLPGSALTLKYHNGRLIVIKPATGASSPNRSRLASGLTEPQAIDMIRAAFHAPKMPGFRSSEWRTCHNISGRRLLHSAAFVRMRRLIGTHIG